MVWLARIWAMRGYLKNIWFIVKLVISYRHNIFIKGLFMTEQVYGVKETIEVIALGLAFGKAMALSFTDDGKLNLADFAKFAPVVPLFMPAVTDIKLVPQEITHINEASLEQIKSFILDNAKDIPGINEKWLQVASGALKMGLGLMEVIEAFKKPVV
jgi:hypothetical protein